MREPTLTRAADPRLTGVVDTLTAGFGVVNRRPWILLFPILLDLFLWFGPRVSAAPLVGQALSRPTLQRAFGDADPEMVQRAILLAADELNLLALLAPGWVGVPSIMPLLGGGRGALTFAGSWTAAVLVSLVALVGGALLGSVYRSVIAAHVREGSVRPTLVAADASRAWARLLGLGVLLVVVGMVLGIPLALVLALAGLAVPALANLALAVAMTLVVWLQVYLFFTPEAIFVSRVGPLRAMQRSVAVVRGNFWAVVRIAVLITIILLGMGQVWVGLASYAPAGLGTALGILGNAYIASGLVAASMLFYYERAAPLPGRSPVVAASEAQTRADGSQ